MFAPRRIVAHGRGAHGRRHEAIATGRRIDHLALGVDRLTPATPDHRQCKLSESLPVLPAAAMTTTPGWRGPPPTSFRKYWRLSPGHGHVTIVAPSFMAWLRRDASVLVDASYRRSPSRTCRPGWESTYDTTGSLRRGQRRGIRGHRRHRGAVRLVACWRYAQGVLSVICCQLGAVVDSSMSAIVTLTLKFISGLRSGSSR